ncbi:hypothetical protein RFI_12176 [Reticulomyxa filosa]|uniref:Uncharacterized protein n=1 Tax=Reticulomyxa filosa TaxID=46433 RepID=X6NG71_RETFI|nr:hypothetical protein RFI_12176 [Reticulomyxa filosa]|eukprot:ETO24971.1 hypothetical protein RFI_12176 [Reticulomyxa filosa]
MQPRIHQALVRQANQQKYMTTQRLYNRPRVSISMPTSPRILNETPTNEDSVQRTSHYKSTSQASGNRIKLEEVAEEPTDLEEDDRFGIEQLQAERNANFESIAFDEKDGSSDVGMTFADDQIAIQALRSEIQEVRSASAANLDRNKQNAAQRVAQKRRRLNMKT